MKRFFSILLTLCMLVTLLPMSIFAEETEVTVSFDANGGSGSMYDDPVAAGSSYTLPDCSFAAPTESEIFEGWALTADGDVIVGETITVNENTVLYAKWVEAYPIYVCGKRVTVKNRTDILGDGTVAFDPTTQTLSLNGCNITATGVPSFVGDESAYSAVYSYGDGTLTVTLNGENTLKGYNGGTGTSAGINRFGNLVIGGTGTLEAVGGEGATILNSAGIYIAGLDWTLTIKDGCTVTSKGSAAATYSVGVLNESGTVTVDSSTLYAVGGTASHSEGVSAEAVVLKNADVSVSGVNRATENAPTLTYDEGYSWTNQKDGTLQTAALDWATVTNYFQIAANRVYTITFDAGEGTMETTSVDTEADGTLASLPSATRSGYSLSGWYTAAEGGTQITADYRFSEDTTVYARWSKRSSGKSNIFTVRFNTNGGSKVKSQNIRRNGKVTEPEAPTKEGFVFGGWYGDEGLQTAYDFDKGVTKAMTLYAKWTAEEQEEPDTHPCPSLAYEDLDVTQWYHQDTDYVLDSGLMMGTGEKTFSPDVSVTRGMVVTMLWRLEGKPTAEGTIPFADVDPDAYYAEAVRWAAAVGVVKGDLTANFAPNDEILREQVATMLFRYADHKGYDVSVGENTNILSYDDVATVSEYAIPAMQYAMGSGLLNSRSETTLNPKDSVTRVEAAAIFHRFITSNQ